MGGQAVDCVKYILRGDRRASPRRSSWRLIVAAVILMPGIGQSASSDRGCNGTDAVAFVSTFYASKNRPQIVPAARELQGEGPPFSRRLRALLRSAADYRDRYIRTRPPEQRGDEGSPPVVYKPPFVDGDVFTGPPDGSSRFVTGEAVADGVGRWRVPVRSEAEDNMSDWAVDVLVVVEHGSCVIDDVRYGASTDDTTLSSVLSWRPGQGRHP